MIPSNPTHLRSHNGFTLIELIMVIVILGILAAFALPKFASLKREATVASVEALAGALRSSINLFQSEYRISGASGSPYNYQGQNIVMVDSLPVASAINVRTIMDSDFPTAAVNTPTWNTAPCAGPGFCIIGSLASTVGDVPAISGFSDGRAFFIWPEGYDFGVCTAYYINEENGNTKAKFGTITTGC